MLGSGSDTAQAVIYAPTQVRDENDPTGFLTGVTQIAVGDHFMLALKETEVT